MPSSIEKHRFSQREGIVLGFTLLYILPALSVSFGRGQTEFVMYVFVMVVLLVPVLTLHRNVGLHPLALWGLSLWGLAHMSGGLMPVPESWPIKGESYVLYNWWIIPEHLKYDQLIHAYGFALTTWICWQALRRACALRGIDVQPTLGLLTLCAAAGMGFGALNEVIEFLATLTIPETNVGGYENTGWDLVSNLTGCIVAALLIALYGRRTPDTHPPAPRS